MIIGYKKVPENDNYFFSTTQKFIRILAGMALPLQDRVLGAVTVLGEIYSPAGPPTLVALGAKVGPWPEVEAAMGQFRRDLKFNVAIVENETYVNHLHYIKALRYAMGEIPLSKTAAPAYAPHEIGRSYVDELYGEGRLHVSEEIECEFDHEPNMAAIALQLACCYMRENDAVYVPIRRGNPRVGRILGLDGL